MLTTARAMTAMTVSAALNSRWAKHQAANLDHLGIDFLSEQN